MVEEPDHGGSSLGTSIERLREEVATRRDLDRAEGEIRHLRDEIVGLRAVMEAQRHKDVDLSPLQSTLTLLANEVKAVDAKVPPLSTLIAAGGVIIAVLGFSYVDLRRMSEPIKDAGGQVQQAADAVVTTTAELKRASTQFQQNQEQLSASVRDLTDRVGGSLTSLGTFDRLLAQILAEVTRIKGSSEAISTSKLGTRPTGKDPMDLLFSAMGDELPPKMSLLHRARQALEDGRFEEARQLASRARDLESDKSESVYDFLIAQSYYREGRFRESEGAFQSAISREPTGGAYNNLGSVYYAMASKEQDSARKQELIEKSIEAIRKSIEIDATSATPFVNLSISQNALGRFQDSLNTLGAYEGSASADILRQRAATLSKLGQHADAISSLTKAIELDPGSALMAAADGDFAPLHDDEAFTKLLEERLGSDLMAAVKAAWAMPDKSDDATQTGHK